MKEETGNVLTVAVCYDTASSGMGQARGAFSIWSRGAKGPLPALVLRIRTLSQPGDLTNDRVEVVGVDQTGADAAGAR